MENNILDKIINFLNNNININIFDIEEYKYKSLPICIIDCVYSLQLDYEITKKVVKNYANVYMDSDIENSSDTLSKFLSAIKEIGFEDFAKNILKNNNKINSHGHYVFRIEVCYELAELLRLLGIETLNDFKNTDERILVPIIKSVSGLKDAACNYLLMLAGDENKCKLDVHLKQFLKDSCNIENISSYDCQKLFNNIINVINNEHNCNLTIRQLDYIIWLYYKNK